MNLSRINAALRKTNAHIKGKRNFLEKVCSLEIDHNTVKCLSSGMVIQMPFTENCDVQLELSMQTSVHTDDEIYDFVKYGIVSHNPKFFFQISNATMMYATKKEIAFNDLPPATIEYLTSLYYKNYDNIDGSYLESETCIHDYKVFHEDFGAIFSTLLQDYSPSIFMHNNILAYGELTRERCAGHNEKGIRRQQIMQILLNDHGLDGPLEPFGEDNAFNFQVLGYSENNIVDAISYITILPPNRGYERFNDDAIAIFAAWCNGEPV